MVISADSKKLSLMFGALGDVNRLLIFKILLNRQGICVSELADELNITPAAVSQHLKILYRQGLVVKKRIGQKMCYEVNLSNQTVDKLIKYFLR